MAIRAGTIYISSDDSSMFSSSSDDSRMFSIDEEVNYEYDMPYPKRGPFTLRGPEVEGREPFDRYCIFGNKMLLDRGNLNTIKEIVADNPGQMIKFYMYKLNPSSVNSTSKMEFGEDFTKTYLKRYLPSTNTSIEVTVDTIEDSRKFPVSMKLGLGKKKKAIITTGWYNIVQEFGLEEAEVVCFDFWESIRDGKLRLTIIHV